MHNSWDFINTETRATIIRKYCTSLSDVLNMIVGFQSFIITYESNQTDQELILYLLITSLGINMFTFMCCILIQNAIHGGIYCEWFRYVHSLLVYLFGIATLMFYTCFIHMTNDLFNINPWYHKLHLMCGILGISAIGVLHGSIEYLKYDRSNKRAIFLEKLDLQNVKEYKEMD